MTDDKIKAIREALEKATPGPWASQGCSVLPCSPDSTRFEKCMTDELGAVNSSEDAHLITLARNELPGLLDELERLRESLAAEAGCTFAELQNNFTFGHGEAPLTYQVNLRLRAELESLRADIKAAQRRMHDAGYKSAAAMLNGIVRGEKSTG